MNNDISPEEKNIRVVQNILDTCSSDLAYMRQKAFDRNSVNIYPRFLLLTLHAQRWLTEGAHSIRLINKAYEYGEFISRKKSRRTREKIGRCQGHHDHRRSKLVHWHVEELSVQAHVEEHDSLLQAFREDGILREV